MEGKTQGMKEVARKINAYVSAVNSIQDSVGKIRQVIVMYQYICSNYGYIIHADQLWVQLLVKLGEIRNTVRVTPVSQDTLQEFQKVYDFLTHL